MLFKCHNVEEAQARFESGSLGLGAVSFDVLLHPWPPDLTPREQNAYVENYPTGSSSCITSPE